MLVNLPSFIRGTRQDLRYVQKNFTALNALNCKCGAAGLTVMKRILAAATLTLLFAAFTAEALTPTPIDAQPYGPVSMCLSGGETIQPLALLNLTLSQWFSRQ